MTLPKGWSRYEPYTLINFGDTQTCSFLPIQRSRIVSLVMLIFFSWLLTDLSIVYMILGNFYFLLLLNAISFFQHSLDVVPVYSGLWCFWWKVSFSPPSQTPIIYMFACLILSHKSLSFSIFLPSFFFFSFPDWLISIAVSTSTLTLLPSHIYW